MQGLKSVFVTLGGGLGDVFCNYFRGENGWGLIESLKTKFPNIRVKALCSTHNPQTLEFIQYNPYVDEAVDPGWSLHGQTAWNKHVGSAVRLSKAKLLTKHLIFKKPKLYLSRRDQEQVHSVISKGSFVLLHPFAGEPHRIGMPAEEYIPLIDQLIDTKGMNVVLVGANYKRHNLNSQEEKPEQLDYERDGLFNFIDKTNSRVIASLANHQTRFIGSWSAYSCLSWLYDKETIVVIQRNQIKKLQGKFSEGERWHGANCRIINTKGPASDPKDTDFDRIRHRILRTFPGGEK